MKILKRTNHFKPHPLFLPEERMCINIIYFKAVAAGKAKSPPVKALGKELRFD